MPIFLNIPGIEGDSVDKNHEKWIEIDQLSHSFDSDTRSAAGRARRGSAATASAFDLNKKTDRASVKLQEALLTGRAFADVTIDLAQRGEQGTLVYLRYELENCNITSFHLSAAGEEAIEAIAINFEEITTIYTPRDERGRPETTIDFGFNVATNTRA